MSFNITLQEITATGQEYAYAVWLLPNDETQINYITQEDYQNGNFVAPVPGATFLCASGGLPAFNTPTGRPRPGDFWLRNSQTREIVLFLSSSPDWQYFSVIAEPPVNNRSRLMGRIFGTIDNALDFTLTNALLTNLRAGTLTRTFGQISITNNVATIPDNYIRRLERAIDTDIDNHRSVSFDAAAGTTNSFGTSMTWNHTVTAAQSNLYFNILHSHRGSTTTGGAYNSVALTSRVTNQVTTNRTAGWDLVNPATGTHSATVGTAGSAAQSAVSISTYGVDQTTPRTGAGGNNNTNTSPSVSVTSGGTSELVVSIVGWNHASGNTDTLDGSWTQAGSQQLVDFAGGSAAYKTGASGTVSRTDTLSASKEWSAVAIAIKDAAGGPTSLNQGETVAITEGMSFNASASQSQTISPQEGQSDVGAVTEAQSMAVTEGQALALSTNLSESVALTEGQTNALTFIQNEQIGIQEAGILSGSNAQSETVALSEGQEVGIEFLQSETLNQTEGIAFSTAVSESESIALSESNQTSESGNEIAENETVGLSEGGLIGAALSQDEMLLIAESGQYAAASSQSEQIAFTESIIDLGLIDGQEQITVSASETIAPSFSQTEQLLFNEGYSFTAFVVNNQTVLLTEITQAAVAGQTLNHPLSFHFETNKKQVEFDNEGNSINFESNRKSIDYA